MCSYRCSYGPRDKRNEPKPPKRKQGYIQKRGYECPFIVKQMASKHNVDIITYNMYQHEGKYGWTCHGQSDRSNEPRVM